NAGGILPDRNVEARRCGAVELSSPIVLVKKKDRSCRFFVHYRQLNNLTRKDAHRDLCNDPLGEVIWIASSGSAPVSPSSLLAGSSSLARSRLRLVIFHGGTGVGQLKLDPSIVLLTIPGLRPFYKSAACYAAALIRSTNGLSVTGDDRTAASQAPAWRVMRGRIYCRGSTSASAGPAISSAAVQQWLLHLVQKPTYLGRIISEKSIATKPNKTSALQEWSTLICVTVLRQFLGLASYYPKFINGFAIIAAPLHRMLEKGTERDIAADSRLRKELSSQYTGHLGERRTLARVKRLFYWPRMSGDVHAWCRTSMQCARRKSLTNNDRAPMQAITEGYFLQQVGVDILGPLERTTSGNQYVLVLTEYFTKWRAAFPLTDMEAGIVAKAKKYNAIKVADFKCQW
ncbi:Retrovirus-related Pol polyprotein from transposon, partial [Trichinella sp. T6]